jgi:hypothetical protein
MSRSDLVHLRVVAGEPGAEVFLIDGQFTLIRRAHGSLEADVPRDLYKLKIRTGERIEERHLSLLPGSEQLFPEHGAQLSGKKDRFEVRFEQVAFDAVAPLAGSEQEDRPAQELGRAESRRIHRRLGRGGELFVMARRTRSARGKGAAPPAGHGIQILDAAGQVIAELTEGRTKAAGPQRCQALTLEVQPGWYRIRIDRDECDLPDVEQAFVVALGWQTQAFVHRRELGSSIRLRTSAMMRERGAGFDPGSAGPRLTELALAGLSADRRFVDPKTLLDLLLGKQTDPMLGIYGGHILATRPDPDLGLLATVVKNLRKLVGRDHPDVEALALALPGAASTVPYPWPPMLAASWRRIVRASAEHPELVPDGSLAEEIAPRLWGGGPFLWWRAEATASMDQAGPVEVSTQERIVQSYLPRGMSASPEAMQQLVSNTGLPRSVIERMAAAANEPAAAKPAKKVRSRTAARAGTGD